MKTTTSATFLALSCVGSLISTSAMAADAGADTSSEQQTERDRRDEREQIIVTGQHYQTQQESPKSTRSVRDTPQTVTVITGETIEQQNLLTLRDMLSTVPGITFGAAEGGSPPADSITLRGYSAGSDITQDGVRDSGAYNRSDNFNMEQLEIVNGANSVYGGSGSVGGSINIVTKRPLTDTRIVASGGIGTDNYYRGAIDANVRASDLIAFRLNAMVNKNDVPGRDVEKYERWGVAPSVTLGVGGPTNLTLQYLHQEDDNIPQYGVPYYAIAGGMLPGIDRSDYFGYRNVDTQEITVDQATLTFEHELGDQVSIRNLSRWQQVSQLTIVGPPQGTFCLANGLTPTGGSCTVAVTGIGNVNVPAGYYLIGGPRGNLRDSNNEIMYNQLDLRAVFNTGAIEHTLVAGASASWEKYFLSTGNVYRNANGTVANAAFPLINFGNPNEIVPGPAGLGRVYGSNVYTGPVNFFESGRQRGEVSNYAVYLFDAMKVGKFELNGGLRWERNSGNYRTDAGAAATLTVPQGAIVPGPVLRNSADLFSYRIGLVFKPVEAVTLYAAYGNSKTPSISAVNGACTVATCNVDPESARNIEIGAKAEVADGKLLLAASAFRNERNQYKVASNDPTIPDQVLDGKSRVDGIALSVIGKITPAWSITANYTYLDSNLRQSISDICLANPGRTGCGNSVAIPDPGRGAEFQQTPKHSGSLFTTYEFPFGMTLGYSLTYQGSFALNLPALATPTTLTPVFRSKDYLVHSAYVAYAFNDKLKAQLNVKNFTDELYFTRVRNNGWSTPGDARAAVFSLTYTH